MPEPIAPTSAPAVLDDDDAGKVEPEENASGDGQPTGEKPVDPNNPNAAPSNPDPLTLLETLEIDPKVKEVLKAGYMRQADYTQKTQEIASRTKAAEAYEQWAPVITFLQENPRIAESLMGTTRRSDNGKPEDELPDDPKEFFAKVKESATQEALQILRQEMTLNSDIDAASKLDARLNTDETFAKQIAGFIEINFGQHVRSGRMSVTEATQRALKAHKEYEESVRQNAIRDISDKAKKKTMVMPSGNGSPLPTASKGGKMTMREAASKAEEEIGSR